MIIEGPHETKRLTVLVTGGAGYIGSTLCRELLTFGFKVKVIDSLIYGGKSLKNLLNHPDIYFYRGDIRNINDIREVLKDVDYIVHLAAIVGDIPCQKNPKSSIEINWLATKMLAEESIRYKVKRFIFASTCSNYGIADTSIPADENRALNPVSLYAETKIDCERYLRSSSNDDFCTVIFRFGSAYGISGRTRFDLVVNSFTFEALQDNRIVVFAAKTWRPYIHVLDISRLLISGITTPTEKVRNQIFNGGSNAQNYMKYEIANMIKENIPSIDLDFIDKKDDISTYRVDFTKVETILGFEPVKTVNDGIIEMIQSIKNGVISIEDYDGNSLKNVRMIE